MPLFLPEPSPESHPFHKSPRSSSCVYTGSPVSFSISLSCTISLLLSSESPQATDFSSWGNILGKHHHHMASVFWCISLSISVAVGAFGIDVLWNHPAFYCSSVRKGLLLQKSVGLFYLNYFSLYDFSSQKYTWCNFRLVSLDATSRIDVISACLRELDKFVSGWARMSCFPLCLHC